MPQGVLAADSGSPAAEFPDIFGKSYYRQGDTEQRRRTVERHAGALERAFNFLATHTEVAEAQTLLVVGHGCSSDFCCSALLGDRFPPALHTGERRYWPVNRQVPADGETQPAPPHVSITTLSRKSANAQWQLDGFAVPTVTMETENAPPADLGSAKL